MGLNTIKSVLLETSVDHQVLLMLLSPLGLNVFEKRFGGDIIFGSSVTGMRIVL